MLVFYGLLLFFLSRYRLARERHREILISARSAGTGHPTRGLASGRDFPPPEPPASLHLSSPEPKGGGVRVRWSHRGVLLCFRAFARSAAEVRSIPTLSRPRSKVTLFGAPDFPTCIREAA